MSPPVSYRKRHATTARPWGELRAIDAPSLSRPPRGPRILIAGADPCKRAAVVRDLRETLPPDTRLGEAGAVSEVLEQAPSCGVVMLADDLGDVSARSLMRLLGQRHPSLPVVALEASANAAPRDAVPAAGRR